MLMDICWPPAIVSLFKQHAMACKLAAVRLFKSEGHGPAIFGQKWPAFVHWVLLLLKEDMGPVCKCCLKD